MTKAAEYDRLAQEIRQIEKTDTGGALDKRTLVHCGTLAASSHNTQPWKFALSTDSITVRPDFARRCPAVDPDDSHLFKSLGCAAENIVLAAMAQGYASRVSLNSGAQELRIDFRKSGSAASNNLFAAIPKRQCTRTLYDGSELKADEQKQLERTGRDKGIRTVILTSDRQLDTVAQYVHQGNREQLSDPAFRKELISWIRFNPKTALKTRDGLSNRTSGNPALPNWLAKRIINVVLTPKKQAETDSKFIRSSSAVAVFVAERNDLESWVNAGRVYERFALHAADLDIRHAFINQPVEVRTLRPQFESWLGLKNESVLLIVRIGRAAPAPNSLRRPLDDVIV